MKFRILITYLTYSMLIKGPSASHWFQTSNYHTSHEIKHRITTQGSTTIYPATVIPNHGNVYVE